jgi:hypothetical protein
MQIPNFVYYVCAHVHISRNQFDFIKFITSFVNLMLQRQIS